MDTYGQLIVPWGSERRPNIFSKFNLLNMAVHGCQSLDDMAVRMHAQGTGHGQLPRS